LAKGAINTTKIVQTRRIGIVSALKRHENTLNNGAHSKGMTAFARNQQSTRMSQRICRKQQLDRDRERVTLFHLRTNIPTKARNARSNRQLAIENGALFVLNYILLSGEY
jgi:Asp/Glu/hydantoin racemase